MEVDTDMSGTETSSHDFYQKSANFVQWLTYHEGTRLSPRIELADLRSRNAGRGVVALQDIAEEEELFAVPAVAVLTADNSGLPEGVLDQIESDSPWLPLIVAIVHKKLRFDSSLWYPYFEVLPTTFDTLMFWTDAELAQLKGCAVVNKIAKRETEEAWQTTILPVMLNHPSLFPVGGDDDVAKKMELVRWAHFAGSLIMAYAFDIDREGPFEQHGSDSDDLMEDNEENPLKGMVPLADMLNADADRNNARLFQEDDFLIMRSIKPIRAGEEIFNDYGALPRSDLLRMYGYVTNNYAKYDVVELAYETITAVARETYPEVVDSTWADRINSANANGLVEAGYDVARSLAGSKIEDAMSGQTHMLLRQLCGGKCRRADWSNHEDIAKFEFTVQEAELLAAILKKRLADYSTSATEDEQLLVGLQSASSTDLPPDVSRTRYKMAIEVRKGEKEVCHDIIRLCSERVKRERTQALKGANKRGRDDSPAARPNKAARKSNTGEF